MLYVNVKIHFMNKIKFALNAIKIVQHASKKDHFALHVCLQIKICF